MAIAFLDHAAMPRKMAIPPTTTPFYTIDPEPQWFTVIKGASDVVPAAKPELADPWSKPPQPLPKICPPAREWIVPEPPKANSPNEDPKPEPATPTIDPDPFFAIRYLPWLHQGARTIGYAVPAPLVPAWNALRCLVELREERMGAGDQSLSHTVRFAMKYMEEEYEEDRKKREEAAAKE